MGVNRSFHERGGQGAYRCLALAACAAWIKPSRTEGDRARAHRSIAALHLDHELIARLI